MSLNLETFRALAHRHVVVGAVVYVLIMLGSWSGVSVMRPSKGTPAFQYLMEVVSAFIGVLVGWPYLIFVGAFNYGRARRKHTP